MKTGLIIGVVILAIIIGGGWYAYTTMMQTPYGAMMQTAGYMAQQQAMGNKNAAANPLLAMLPKSVADAMAKGVGMVCTKTETNGESTQIKILGNDLAVVDKKANGEISNAVFAGGAMYVWENNAQEGFKMSFGENAPQVQQGFGYMGMVGAMGAMKDKQVDCAPGSVSASDFSVPQTVEFKDYSEMMKGMGDIQKAMQDAQNNIPANMQDAMQENTSN